MGFYRPYEGWSDRRMREVKMGHVWLPWGMGVRRREGLNDEEGRDVRKRWRKKGR